MIPDVAEPRRYERLVLLALALAILVISGIGPADRLTWVLEVLPVMIGAVLLVGNGRRWPLTPLLYRLQFAHAVILMIGEKKSRMKAGHAYDFNNCARHSVCHSGRQPRINLFIDFYANPAPRSLPVLRSGSCVCKESSEGGRALSLIGGSDSLGAVPRRRIGSATGCSASGFTSSAGLLECLNSILKFVRRP